MPTYKVAPDPSWDSKVQVTIKLVLDIHTDSNPEDITIKTWKEILASQVQDYMKEAHFTRDIANCITQYKFLEGSPILVKP